MGATASLTRDEPITTMPERTSEIVTVLGASPKKHRYAYRAMEMLRDYGHRAVPINPAFKEILGETCYPSIKDAPQPIDTVTMYLGKQRSDPLIADILEAKPRRIIMNPGAENEDLAREARAKGIEVVEGCTLVMLQVGNF
jgi:predicted CoA-binding protein